MSDQNTIDQAVAEVVAYAKQGINEAWSQAQARAVSVAQEATEEAKRSIAATSTQAQADTQAAAQAAATNAANSAAASAAQAVNAAQARAEEAIAQAFAKASETFGQATQALASQVSDLRKATAAAQAAASEAASKAAEAEAARQRAEAAEEAAQKAQAILTMRGRLEQRRMIDEMEMDAQEKALRQELRNKRDIATARLDMEMEVVQDSANHLYPALAEAIKKAREARMADLDPEVVDAEPPTGSPAA